MLRMRSQILTALAVLAVTLAACGQDRIGNAPAEVITLRGETPIGPDEIFPYLDEVAKLSGDTVSLDVFESTSKPLDIESQVVDRVASGSLDIGFVGTRTWAGKDVHAFDALQAPFLIDSYELQQAVLEGGVIDETDDGLESLGLVSLGVLPGPLRVPSGREGPYVGAADYAGAKIGMSDAAITEATLGALGATAVALLFGTEDVEGVDGMEAQVGAVPFDGRGAMHFVTGNVVLWPRPISIVMNAERYAALTPEQQAWLREAVGSSLDEMTARAQTLDRDTVGNACRNGAQFVNASTADLAGLRAAVEPVYSSLRKDQSDKPRHRRDRGTPELGWPHPRLPGNGRSLGHAGGFGPGPGRDPRGWHVDGVPHRGGRARRGRRPGRGPDQRRVHDDVVRRRAPFVRPARARPMRGRARTRSKTTS